VRVVSVCVVLCQSQKKEEVDEDRCVENVVGIQVTMLNLVKLEHLTERSQRSVVPILTHRNV
jgi:hypothetical protein